MEQSTKNQIFNKVDDTTFKIDISEKYLSVVVGDEKQSDFKPRLKIKKWDNEVNFSVGVIDDGSVSTHELRDNKIIWSQGNKEAHFYPKDNGDFEFEILLKEKPISNILELSIQTKGLDFFFQPLLTEEERLAMEIHRPENVEGSYAVYHKTQQGNYSALGGKNYMAGKAFHIFRPKIIDADEKWAWGKLNIDVDRGVLSIEIPQSILDNGKYPLSVDPTFGNTSTAGTLQNSNIDWACFVKATPTSGDGTVSKLTLWAARHSPNDIPIKAVIWLYSTKAIITGGVGGTVSIPAGDAQSWDITYSTPPSVVNNTDYYIGIVDEGITKDESHALYFDTGAANTGGQDKANNYTTPAAIGTITDNTRRYEIYATYTAGAPPASSSNFLMFM
jgi:hypothetical protein